MERYYKLPCYCDRGLMLYLQASKYANNPGRFFYKCPLDDTHKFNFIWANELMEPKYKHLHQYVHEQDVTYASFSSAPATHQSTTTPVNDVYSPKKHTDMDQFATESFSSPICKKPCVGNVTDGQGRNAVLKEDLGTSTRLGAISLICCCVGSFFATVRFGMALLAIAIALYK